ncbi:MAG: c-type cytochrome [Solirubrobacterales bacterium]
MKPMRPALLLLALLAGLAVAGCGGNNGGSVNGQSAVINEGAQLFHERCAGCHALSVVGAEGSATKVNDRERPDGPNFNVRKECYGAVMYAIQNGGFSGAIMPANIVVGPEAKAVSAFLQEYSGKDVETQPSVTGKQAACPPLAEAIKEGPTPVQGQGTGMGGGMSDGMSGAGN